MTDQQVANYIHKIGSIKPILYSNVKLLNSPIIQDAIAEQFMRRPHGGSKAHDLNDIVFLKQQIPGFKATPRFDKFIQLMQIKYVEMQEIMIKRFEQPSQKLIRAAIKSWPGAIRWIDQKFLNDNIKMYAIKQDSDVIELIKDPTPKMIRAAKVYNLTGSWDERMKRMNQLRGTQE